MKKSIVAAVVTCILATLVFYFSNMLIHRGDKKTLTVGFVCMGDEIVPFSNNFLKVQDDIKQKYGNKVKVFKRCNVSQKSGGSALQELIDKKCDLIITDSSIFADVAKKYAKKYPEVQFCQAASANANTEPVLKNYHNFMGRICEGRYVSGIVAGMKIKELMDEGKITASQAKMGYVAAYPYAEVISGYTAFILGVRSVVPEAVMEVGYVGSWNNFYKEEKLAKKMIEDNCIIISQHSDTNGPAIACEKAVNDHIVFHVGYNESMTEVAPTTSLVSTKINWSEYILTAIDAVMNGKKIESQIKGVTKGQDSWAGFDENWIQMLEFNNAIVAKKTEKKVSQTIEKLKKNQINIFKGNYTGVNPEDPNDTIDLKNGYTENKNASSPSFHYVLNDVITIIDNK